MELGDRQLPGDRTEMEREWYQYVQGTVGVALSNYGWYILLGCITIYFLVQKMSASFKREGTSRQTAAADPNEIVRRQEAVAAARMRMQEELNTQAELYREKQIRLQEEKRRKNIESWERMKEGKSLKDGFRLSQDPTPSTSAPSSEPKPKPERKPLRGSGYNPLTGDGGGVCTWRPGRRGPSSGG
ncbi:hypothetical protein GDO86_006468 [Hymenochirus boettgeri]|uniref:Selenoprotein S n=1 Tax=Hymenochirus boettgeri TaxID=247094 RepID=A0A8T2JE49_9PIPI|nr:hypothetical protein GDO86_006468 [Hymenochirus boettgeri]